MSVIPPHRHAAFIDKLTAAIHNFEALLGPNTFPPERSDLALRADAFHHRLDAALTQVTEIETDQELEAFALLISGLAIEIRDFHEEVTTGPHRIATASTP